MHLTRLTLVLPFLPILSCFAAETLSSPQQIVAALYVPYLSDPQAEKLSGTPNSLDAIAARASGSLRKAIQKERACERREGICHIDFDIIICGQDWDLSDFHLAASQDVTVKFRNGDQRAVVRYLFVKEDSAWKIDEVEATCFSGEEGAQPVPFRLKRSLLGE